MKYNEKEQARKLRQEQGLSIKTISKQLGVAQSSVSVWVRDIPLTEEQCENLKQSNPVHNGQLRNSGIRVSALNVRKQYQLNGRQLAKENTNVLFLKGCMLYWAEGTKRRNYVDFTNSDVNMMILFSQFLRECFGVSNDKITISVNCYLNNGLSQKEIENYWLEHLGLDESSLRKTQINKLPSSSKSYKQNKLIYGVCKLRVHKSEIIQTIYGAIKEFANINDDRWLS